MKNILFAALLAGSAFSAEAQIYKWVDDQGRVHYSDQPRDEAREISREMSPLNVSEGSDSGYRPYGAPEAGADTPTRAELAEQRAQQARCQKARQELKVLSGPVYFTDDEGEEFYVSEAEREQMAADLRATIAKHCD